MSEVTVLGIDIAKSVFQLHGVDGAGRVRYRRQVRRAQLLQTLAQLPRCRIALEACGGAHHWGRQIGVLGHEVRLIPAQYVKAFVRGQKNDRNDAAAICEAARQPAMRCVAVKSLEQQQILALHRIRVRMVKERTALVNQVRGLLMEFGIVIPRSLGVLRRRLPEILAGDRLPELLRVALCEQQRRLGQLDGSLASATAQLSELARRSEPCRALMAHGASPKGERPV